MSMSSYNSNSLPLLIVAIISAPFITQITHAQTEHNAVIQQMWLKTGEAASLGLFALFFFGYFGGQQRYEKERIGELKKGAALR